MAKSINLNSYTGLLLILLYKMPSGSDL